jgi:hypothetical protein
VDEIWRHSPPVYLGLLEDKRAEDAVLEREKARIAHVKSSAEHVAPAVEFKTPPCNTPVRQRPRISPEISRVLPGPRLGGIGQAVMKNGGLRGIEARHGPERVCHVIGPCARRDRWGPDFAFRRLCAAFDLGEEQKSLSLRRLI